MRKLSAIFTLVVSSAILIAAMDQSFINGLKQKRYFDHLDGTDTTDHSLYHRFFIRSDRWRYGDLYGLCFLHEYKFRLEPFTKYNTITDPIKHNRLLYIIGDSFLADKTLDHAFKGFDHVIFLDRRFPFGPIVLDTTQQNYLIMEFAERNLPQYSLKASPEITWTAQDIQQKLFTSKEAAIQKAPASQLPRGLERVTKALFNKDLSRNIETLLFDDKLFTPIKELKAAFNYHVLGRLPQEVAVSRDKKRLFLNITVDTSYVQSAFRPTSDQDVAQIAHQISLSGDYYRAIGFKKVLLSVVPNPVSIYDSKQQPYNHLLERVENRTDIPVISIYHRFKSNPRNLYYRSDAHWNPEGMNCWVKTTDSVLTANR